MIIRLIFTRRPKSPAYCSAPRQKARNFGPEAQFLDYRSTVLLSRGLGVRGLGVFRELLQQL